MRDAYRGIHAEEKSLCGNKKKPSLNVGERYIDKKFFFIIIRINPEFSEFRFANVCKRNKSNQ